METDPSSDHQELYWAVVEHVRTWLGDDGPFIQAIKSRNGALDGITLRRIAINYNVSRGIRARTEKGDTHAEALAQLINGTKWPSELLPRAKVCAELAREAHQRGHTVGVQLSAMSKLSWFAEPSNWTVYDRFVARAVSVQNMISFYEALDQRGFLSFAQRISPPP